MTGRIELHHTPKGHYQARLVDDLGQTLAVSTEFDSKKAALEGIFALREIAGTAHVSCSPPEPATGRRAQEPAKDGSHQPKSTPVPQGIWPHR